MNLTVKPIGHVERNGHETRIVIHDEYREALDFIEHFTHLIVIYWLHKVPEHERNTVKVKPPFKNVPTLGIFATRFPARPNPLGLTTVRLISKQGNSLLVEELDADHQTPILDLKPYIPLYDRPKGRAKLPNWVKRHIKHHHNSHPHHHTIEELLATVKRIHKNKTS
ncbi:MAG: tRNA (N6-threonylcarbamoyladenosine(37)-N6)-methyltransferase TrmO [Thermoprotei archaeon]|nr:MAG: tRNA (N6-threonylcarbamoyladenosine(37)-N6)-methyltransferase TrmO [Thermoprotei archaeon]